VANAAVWPFIHDGIPIIYNGADSTSIKSAVNDTRLGQEQGLSGGYPPANHEA